MFLASAYPSPAISAGAMTAIALVAVGSLTFWLVMVYVAARAPRKPTRLQTQSGEDSALTAPHDAAQDEHKTAA